ncbi:MAG: hypothetical protein WKF82_09770 [Nocardioidaceae bacterium]
MNWCPTDSGEEVNERLPKRLEHRVDPVVLRPDRRPEVIGRSPSTEDEPVIGGALAVDDEVAVVREGLATG